ncbi:MAG: alpha-L-fucosidase [Lentisphaeria bacterium]|nr:alpha-L-fucosidase [Lentisphaeria bacterium]
MAENSEQEACRRTWFEEARFGLFVHWGCYAVLGRGEQIMARDLMPLREFEPLAQQFRPRGDWARRLASRAVAGGARYVVLTTRHHDGYCLFDTATHGFTAARTGPGRDLVREYVEALRAAGLRIGFYYSLLNWRWRCHWDPVTYADELPRMVAEVHTQVRELMTRYGKIDILWYDAPSLPGSAAHGMWGGKALQVPAAEFWRSAELNAMARELQPGILINNRSGLPEDFGTPEQRVEAEGGRLWETCMTVNYAPGWGYLRHSMANKAPGEVLFNLVDAVRLGGNFLLNVGPRADGAIDAREGEVLDRIGRWLGRHGEAVYGTCPARIYPARGGRVQGPMFHYGMWTCRGSVGYLSLFYYPGEELILSKIGPRVVSASLLTTGEALQVDAIPNGRWRIGGLPSEPPDPLAPVVKVSFEGPPYALTDLGPEWLDGTWRPAGPEHGGPP